MKAFGLARIGRDAELRKTQSGESVIGLSLAFSYGRKDADGKRPTQWVDATLWGKRAEALAPYLQKGGLVAVSLEEVHMETYQNKGVEGHKLAARVVDIELAGGSKDSSAAAPPPTPPRAAPQQGGRDGGYSNTHSVPPQRAASGFDDMDDDIPF